MWLTWPGMIKMTCRELLLLAWKSLIVHSGRQASLMRNRPSAGRHDSITDWYMAKKKNWTHLTKLWKKQFHTKSSMNIHTHHPHCVHICPGCDENKSCIPLSCATLNCMLEQEARVLVVWDAEHRGRYFSQPNQGSYKNVSVIVTVLCT